MAQRVFISHSSKDSDIANQVCQSLEEQDIPCWVAPRDVPPGAPYGAAIVNAIEDSIAMVFIFSENSNRSEQVMNEIERSVSKAKPIFPIKISPIAPSSELEYFISRRHWLDLTTTPLDRILPQLAEALHHLQTDLAPPEFRGADNVREPERLFVMEASREGERLKLSAYEQDTDAARTLQHYEYIDVAFDEVNVETDMLMSLLNQATNNRGTLDADTWSDIKSHGERLYQLLLTPEIRKRLEDTRATNLWLHINDALVQLPWELLFDGHAFLCRRFSIGRFVSTQQEVVERQSQRQDETLKMLIIANPQGTLEAADREGDTLWRELQSEARRVQIDLRKAPVDAGTARAAIPKCDVLHYAGHADYDANEPSKSGWLLAHGDRLSAAEIRNLGESDGLPALVFCNACESGQTSAWEIAHSMGQEIYGLANAFLLGGTRHYIGSFWKIPDDLSNTFAVAFYRALARGATIGTALREARQRLISRYGDDSVVWASYMLYGDPTTRYLALPEVPASGTQTPSVQPSVSRGGMPSDARRRKPLLVTAAVVVVLMTVLAVFLMSGDHGTRSAEAALSLAHQYRLLDDDKLSQTAKQTRRDRLVEEILKADEAGTALDQTPDGWTSKPLIMAFLRGSFTTDGGNGEALSAPDEALLNNLEQALRDTGRFTIVERELLDQLLEELKLNTTDLVDKQTANRVGHLLGAGLLVTGAVVHRDDHQLSVRLIHTETSSILVSGNHVFDSSTSAEHVTKPLAEDLLQKLLKDPKAQKFIRVRGEIVSLTPRLILNVGAEHGVTPEMIVEVVVPIDVGGKTAYVSRDDDSRLKVISVQEQSSLAATLKDGVPLEVGWKVREVLEP